MVSELESYLNNLIAEMDGIRPEDVTVEYIHEQREKRIYPVMFFKNNEIRRIADDILREV